MTNTDRMQSPSGRRGFTIVEVIIAMMIMTIAVLALASSSGLVAKMILRGHNAEMASSFAMRRMDQLRMIGCVTRVNGADTLFRGGPNWAAINSWEWSDAGKSTYRIKTTTRFRATGGTIATDISETSISCIM